MSSKFHGSLDDLKRLLETLSLDGDWSSQPNRVWKLQCRNRSGLHWSETRGTVWFDGPEPARALLAAKVTALLDDPSTPRAAAQNARIFVVHGRDRTARDELELVLHRLDLDPFILQTTGGEGDTLIEALEQQIGKTAECSFGIVLVTPDDIGFLKEDGVEEARPRARQNVIMEMGMLLASLTRRRCAILQKGTIELPSNMGGLLSIPFRDHVKETVPKLVQRLQGAGFQLDPRKIGLAQS